MKSYACTLLRLSVASTIRTDSVFGLAQDKPQKGKSFWLQGEPLNGKDGYVRQVNTSPIKDIVLLQNVLGEDVYDFFTDSGNHYQVVVHGEVLNSVGDSGFQQ